jgi:hypothetical protein
VTSFALTLAGLILYEKSKTNKLEKFVDPYTGNTVLADVETKPSVTFAAIGGVNTVLSAVLLIVCWRSSKVC